MSLVNGEQEITLDDGRRLHVLIAGDGAPTVVFEAGMGSSLLTWALVAPRVAERSRTVVYDRSGIGGSPTDHQPRTVARAAADLVELLAQLDDGPCVLVAHSYGGPIVRTAAAAAPDLVGGIVLVDQTDEQCELYFTESHQREQQRFAKLLPLMARLGVVRAATRRAAAPLPGPTRKEFVAQFGSVANAHAQRAELEHIDDDLAALRDRPPSLPDVPITYISGTRPTKVRPETRLALIEAHRAGAAAAPKGRHVEAPGSDHMVMFTDPDIVVAETLRLVDAAG